MAEKEVLKETDEWIKNLKNLLQSVSVENQEYVQSRIKLLEKLRKQNLRYRYALHETKTVLKEAIESLSNNEKVNGLEWAIKEINKALDESK